jgi:hypothetical protein
MANEKLRVVLVHHSAKPALEYGKSILAEPFIALEKPLNMRHAFDAICRDLPKLVICEMSLEDGPIRHLLDRVAEGVQTRRPPFLLVGNPGTDMADLPLQPRVLRLPTPLDRFNAVVMEMLGYKPRSGRRHMVRLHFKEGSSDAANSLLGSSVTISPKGMLLESKKKLAIGLSLRLEIMGVPDLKDLELRAKVLREEPPAPNQQGTCYAVEFENIDPFDVQRLTAYLYAG